MGYLHQFVFGYFPYIALSVFLVGSLIRFDREQYTWRSGSSQMLRKDIQISSNLFHIGILLLFFGHLVGLLTPSSVYHGLGLSTEAKQLVAIVAGSFFGLMCMVGLTMLVFRRLNDPRIAATSTRSDVFILVLVWVQLMLGLLTIPYSLSHPDGSTMVMLAEWAQHIVTIRAGAAEQIVSVAWVYKAHLFLGMIMFLVFPFTRLVHIWSAPVWYLGRTYQIVRTRRRQAA